jgi:hypothetical protein
MSAICALLLRDLFREPLDQLRVADLFSQRQDMIAQ